MEIKLVSGALGAEVKGIDLKDSSLENWKKINNLLLEHKALFFRDQDITSEEQINLAKHFGPLERHIYVKGRKDYPEILRIIKAPEEKRQWGETWHTDVSYNPKPTKVIILRSIKVPPVGGDTMFSNMEIAYDTLSDKIKDKVNAAYGYNAVARIRITQTAETGFEFAKVNGNTEEQGGNTNLTVVRNNVKASEQVEGVENKELREALAELEEKVLTKSTKTMS